MVAPSPHAQLWRWDVEKWMKGIETTISTGTGTFSGDITMTEAAPTGMGFVNSDLWFGAAGTSPNAYWAWNDKADSTGTNVMQLSETGALTVNGRVTLGALAATGTITGSFAYDNSSANTPSLIVMTGLLSNIAANNGQRQGLQIFNGNNTAGPAAMAFHRSGSFAGYLGLDTDNVMKIGGWSYGANAYPIALMNYSNAGNFTAVGSVVSNQNFISSTVNVVLAPTGNGNIFFRPNGA